jgi:hypothetical protein
METPVTELFEKSLHLAREGGAHRVLKLILLFPHQGDGIRRIGFQNEIEPSLENHGFIL